MVDLRASLPAAKVDARNGKAFVINQIDWAVTMFGAAATRMDSAGRS